MCKGILVLLGTLQWETSENQFLENANVPEGPESGHLERSHCHVTPTRVCVGVEGDRPPERTPPELLSGSSALLVTRDPPRCWEGRWAPFRPQGHL